MTTPTPAATDTGIYLPTTGQIGFTAGGVARLILTTSTLKPNANDGVILGNYRTGFGGRDLNR